MTSREPSWSRIGFFTREVTATFAPGVTVKHSPVPEDGEELGARYVRDSLYVLVSQSVSGVRAHRSRSPREQVDERKTLPLGSAAKSGLRSISQLRTVEQS